MRIITCMTKSESQIVTLTKAIGIILMVMAHAMPVEHIIWRFIYVFHMPLFFIMSGYCFKEEYLCDTKHFVITKLKGIWLPYIAFSLPFLALHNVFCSLYLYPPDSVIGLKTFLWDAGRIVTRMSNSELFLCAFWFLKELFWGNLIYYCIMRLLKGRVQYVTIILLILSELTILIHFRIPYFGITFVSFFAAFFIAIGTWWRQAQWRFSKWWIWLIALIIIIGNMFIPYDSFMRNVTPSTLPIYVIPAIVGTMIVFEICRFIQPYLNGFIGRLLYFIGTQTLWIMSLHFLAFKIVQYGIIKYYNLPILQLSKFPVLYDYANVCAVLLSLFVGVFVPLCIAWLWLQISGLLKNRLLF